MNRSFKMSPRLREIAKLVIAGQTNAAIAEELCLSPETVRDHVYTLRSRTRSASREELVESLRAYFTAESDAAIIAARREPRLWCHV